jgi:hypothetical protein
MRLFSIKTPEVASSEKTNNTEPSAAQRVMETPELRDIIIAHSSPRDYGELRKVNRAFAVSLNAPLIWRDEYAPADISWPSRTIYTAVVPNAGAEPKADADNKRPQQNRALGTYKGELWTLITGLPPKREDGDIADGDLDEVASMTAVAHGFRIEAIGPGDAERTRSAERERAYNFLLDRGYRLRTGQPIATYRKEVPRLIALTSAFIGAQCIMLPGLNSFAENINDLNGWAQVRNKVAFAICGVTWTMTSVVAGFVIVLMTGDDMTMANMMSGPTQKRKLDAWALQVAAAQQRRNTENFAEKSSSSFDSGFAV